MHKIYVLGNLCCEQLQLFVAYETCVVLYVEGC